MAAYVVAGGRIRTGIDVKYVDALILKIAAVVKAESSGSTVYIALAGARNESSAGRAPGATLFLV